MLALLVVVVYNGGYHITQIKQQLQQERERAREVEQRLSREVEQNQQLTREKEQLTEEKDAVTRVNLELAIEKEQSDQAKEREQQLNQQLTEQVCIVHVHVNDCFIVVTAIEPATDQREGASDQRKR